MKTLERISLNRFSKSINDISLGFRINDSDCEILNTPAIKTTGI